MAKTVQINLRIPEEKLKKLKSIARLKSVQENKDILYTDLVRDGIDAILENNEGQ